MTPTLSVEAIQLRLTWVGETAVAWRPAGTEGAVVSPVVAVVYNRIAALWLCKEIVLTSKMEVTADRILLCDSSFEG